MNSGPGSIRDSTGNADDMVHRMLGLTGQKYQDLYHFTIGRAEIDPRQIDLPAYE